MGADPVKKTRELPQIPGYRIEGVVGRGATGVVYRARQNSVDRVVALKVLHPELVGSASALRRMQREARLTAKLAHPNIISAIDMGELDGQLWYAMELIDGLSLAERIAERPLSEREALRIFIPLCEALRHAHERGVVHRDIKPANILIERGGRALLVDLGLAYSESDPVLTKSGGTLGTPHYISPEQARDPASADVQSDLWSFGATLYHAVTGRTPFRGENVAEILSNVLYARVPDPREQASALSSGIVLVLRKCLTRDRESRYKDPAELLADLERLRERRAPQIARSGLDPLERRPLGGPRLVALIAAGVLVLVGGAWLGWRTLASGSRGGDEDTLHDPFAALDQACEGPATGVGAALAEVERRSASEELSPHARAHLDSIRNRLVQRLDGELVSHKAEVEAEAEKHLVARDFEGALRLSQANPRTALAARIGTRSLPETQSNELDAWRKTLEQRVREARDGAEQTFTAELDHYGDELRLRVDALEQQGDWKSAHELTSRSPEQLLADSGVDTRGIQTRVLDLRSNALRERVDARRKALVESWTRTDQDLVNWIESRTQGLSRELEARRTRAASRALQSEFDEELERRGTNPEKMPVGLPHYALEAVVAQGQKLDELEQANAEEDSAHLFDELEQQTEPFWRARSYEEVERRFGQAEGLLRGKPAARAALRVREARLLTDVLDRAAKTLVRSSNQRMELTTGTVPEVGLLEVPPDPLANGFKLRPDGAVPRSLVLRRPQSGEKSLATESLAHLAGLGPDDVNDPSDRLLRALFLFHEAEPGDLTLLEGVRTLLDRGPMPAADTQLVEDLGRRVAERHGRTLDLADREKREKLLQRLKSLRSMVDHGGDARTARDMADDLLKADVWREDERAELRTIRDEQAQRLQSGPLEELASSFSPDALEDAGSGRVRLFFDLSKQHGGALKQGAWILNQRGWAPAFAARSDDELLEREGPSLQLEPLRTDKDPIEITLQLEQPADQPPRVLLVSVAGLHVGFLGATDTSKARWLASSRSAAELLEQLRRGGGRPFPGWQAGSRPNLQLVCSRAPGRVQVKLDGSIIDRMDLPTSRLDAPPELVVRAWEPLRLLTFSIVARR
ncbi:MAG: protein kinase [Planctomycetes bacterium]|nr:protein kinase [Planctomycetota bacterium]